MEFSEIIGKPVLNAAGDVLGYVLSAYADADLGLCSLRCADPEEEEFFLPARAVRSVRDAVVADRFRLKSPRGIPSPVGKSVFNGEGALLGVACAFDSDSRALTVLGLGGKQVYPADLLLGGDTIVVCSDAAEKTARLKAARTLQNATRSPKNAPSAQSDDAQNAAHAPENATHSPKNAPSAQSDDAQNAAHAPQNATRSPKNAPSAQSAAKKKAGDTTPANANFQNRSADLAYRGSLLGKQVKKEVVDGNGDPLARAGDTVTPPVLKRARKENRLLELAANTLTE